MPEVSGFEPETVEATKTVGKATETRDVLPMVASNAAATAEGTQESMLKVIAQMEDEGTKVSLDRKAA